MIKFRKSKVLVFFEYVSIYSKIFTFDEYIYGNIMPKYSLSTSISSRISWMVNKIRNEY